MCFRPPEVKPPWVCDECGMRNPGTSDTCRKCGTARPVVEVGKVTCPNCGWENDADANICHNCGLLASELAKMMGDGGAGAPSMAAPGVPAAPGAPNVPAAPGPKIPTAPGPKIPTAPGPKIPAAPTGPGSNQ